jgi:hypothetical protein
VHYVLDDAAGTGTHMWWMTWRAPVHYVVDDVAGIVYVALSVGVNLRAASARHAAGATAVTLCVGVGDASAVGPGRRCSPR